MHILPLYLKSRTSKVPRDVFWRRRTIPLAIAPHVSKKSCTVLLVSNNMCLRKLIQFNISLIQFSFIAVQWKQTPQPGAPRPYSGPIWRQDWVQSSHYPSWLCWSWSFDSSTASWPVTGTPCSRRLTGSASTVRTTRRSRASPIEWPWWEELRAGWRMTTTASLRITTSKLARKTGRREKSGNGRSWKTAMMMIYSSPLGDYRQNYRKKLLVHSWD